MLWKDIKHIYQTWECDEDYFYVRDGYFKIKIAHFTRIEDGAQIENGAIIGAYARIEDKAVIGAYAQIEDRAQIEDGAVIGAYTRIEGGTQIGAYARIKNFAQIGNDTQIGDFTQIGNRVQIEAHVHIGNDVKIGNMVYIGNDTQIGDYTQIGDNATIEKSLTYITTSAFPVYLYDPSQRKIGIGCEIRTIDEWLGKGVKVAKKYGINKDLQDEYRTCVELFAKVHKWEKKE